MHLPQINLNFTRFCKIFTNYHRTFTSESLNFFQIFHSLSQVLYIQLPYTLIPFLSPYPTHKLKKLFLPSTLPYPQPANTPTPKSLRKRKRGLTLDSVSGGGQKLELCATAQSQQQNIKTKDMSGRCWRKWCSVVV